MTKLFVSLFLVVVVAIALRYYFFYDNVVTSGDKYGFVIGMSKDKAIRVISKDYAETSIQVILSPKSTKMSIDEVEYLDVNELNREAVEGMNVWQIRFDRDETDVLVLNFSNDRLIEMHRYRRAFIP